MPLVAPLVPICGLSIVPGVCRLVWASKQHGRGLPMRLELTKKLVKPSPAPRPKVPLLLLTHLPQPLPWFTVQSEAITLVKPAGLKASWPWGPGLFSQWATPRRLSHQFLSSGRQSPGRGREGEWCWCTSILGKSAFCDEHRGKPQQLSPAELAVGPWPRQEGGTGHSGRGLALRVGSVQLNSVQSLSRVRLFATP